MDLEKLLMYQDVPCGKYPEADQAACICMKYVEQDNSLFAINLGISYGIILGKRLARRKGAARHE